MKQGYLMKSKLFLSALVFAGSAITAAAQDSNIVHDAEYYVLKQQNEAVWVENDAQVDQLLADFREKNGGNPPNIFYILIDDMGFGDMGMPEMNAIRGYSTPNINALAEESMRFARMYTEPSCTPSRVAFMTGRQPYRNGMGDTAVDISGFGLADEEVTIAEVLKSVGYNTSHVANGTWATFRNPGLLIRALTTPRSPSISRASWPSSTKMQPRKKSPWP